MRIKTKAYCGFTLVELLVVISIIALLLAVLMPALNRARGQAKKIACGARMKQHSLGLGMYANNYNGSLPPFLSGSKAPFLSPDGWLWEAGAESYWQIQLAKAIGVNEKYGSGNMPTGPMWQCTERSKHPTRSWATWYAINTNLVIWNQPGAPNRITPYKIAAIKNPAGIIFETDAVQHCITLDYGQGFESWCYPKFAGTNKPNVKIDVGKYLDDARHLGQCEILWLDGHISSLARKDFMTRSSSSLWVPKVGR